MTSSLPKVDLVLLNGRVYHEGALQEEGVAVNNGKIVAIGKEVLLPAAEQVYDAKGNLVLPGLIDLHVHFRDPGYPDREDFFTGTLAAAAGGVTLVGDMPNPNPPTTNARSYSEKLRIAKKKAVVDFHLYGGVGDTNIDQIGSISALGARLFKSYTTSKYKALYASSEESICRILERTKARKALFMIHAEDQRIIDEATMKVKNSHHSGFFAHTLSRPPESEIQMIKMVLTAAKNSRAPAYICHISTAQGVEAIRKSKHQGVTVYAETCPHYLSLTEADGIMLGPYAKTNPPLRTTEDREALWRGLHDGTIDVLSSDHCPYTVEEKNNGLDDIFLAPPGMPGLDTTLSIMLNHVNNGRFQLKQLISLYSEKPAKILGIYPRKGTLSVGSDADVTIVDPRLKWTVKGEDLYTKSKITMFEGFEVTGRPVATFVRGRLVMRDGEVMGKAGYGQPV